MLKILELSTLLLPKKTKVERSKLPHHINIIDELHINENGHSRILLKLLQFTNGESKYEILESFIGYIKNKKQSDSFNKIRLAKPHLTQEECRIDLWVRDETYALIIENKIYNAADQDNQLARYIDITKSNYKEDDIFIIYLSQSGQEPAEQSWGEYKDVFADRYVSLSFRDDILPWLKDDIYPNIRQKDIFLQSTVYQYIDYLDGFFYLRESLKQLNMNLSNFIKDYFNEELANKNEEHCYDFLQEKINENNELLKNLQNIQNEYRDAIIQQWKEITQQKYPDFHPNEYYPCAYTCVGIDIDQSRAISVHIGIDSNQLYCELRVWNKETGQDENFFSKDTSLSKEFQSLLPKKNGRGIWQYFPKNKFKEAYSRFEEVITLCVNIINNKQLHL